MTEFKKILVIDDNEADSNFLKRIIGKLKLWDLRVEECTNEADADELLLKNQYDVVFVDYLLGATNGINLIKKYLLKGLKTSFVLLTGYGSESVVADALRAGSIDYLNKSQIDTESIDRILWQIFEKQKADQRIFEFENRLRRVLENTSTILIVVSDLGVIQEVNSSFLKLFEIENSDCVIGKSFYDYVVDEQQENIKTIFQDCISFGFVNNIELVCNSPHSQRIYLVMNANFESNQVNPTITCLCHDITDRKLAEFALIRSEEELIKAQKIAKMGSWTLNYFTGKFLWSEELYNIFEFDKETVGDNLLEAFKNTILPEFQSDHFYAHQKAIQTGKLETIEYKIALANGEEKFVKEEGEFQDNNGKILIGIIQDITDQKWNEIAPKEAKSKAEVSDKLKTAFLANLSHEIRTPMNAIIGFSNLLLFPDITRNQREEYIDKIQKSSESLLHLIEDIIDIARIEAEQIVLKESQCFVNKIFNELLEVFNHEKKNARKDQIEMIFSKQKDEIDFNIQCDPHRFRQICYNLIDNALKYTEHGYIEFGYTLLDNTILQCYFKDTGVGIADEYIPHIFDSFWKGSNDPKKLYKGTGIGLSIAKKLVEHMGGRIWVKSKIGVGTTFYFTLPTHILNENDKMIPNELNLFDNELKGFSVLIVEDEESNYLYLSELLSRSGLSLFWEENGYGAIEFIEKQSVDLVILDLLLPGIDGVAVLRKIKESRPSMKVIVLTSFAQPESMIQCEQIGCDAYLKKPFDANELFLNLKKLFGKG